MREMKDSGNVWTGNIPKSWNMVRLGYLSKMIVPMRDKPTRFDGNIPWIRIEDFDGMYISSSKSGQNVSKSLIKEMNMKVYPIGTVLCSCSCNLGFCAITTSELCSNQTFIGIVPNERLDARFLYYVMSSSKKRLNTLSQGTIQAYLSQDNFAKLNIAVCNKEEQIKIADFLDKKCAEIDALIKAKEKTNALLKERRQSIIYEAVTKGLNPDVQMKDSGIEWIGKAPKTWNVIRFKHLHNGLNTGEAIDRVFWSSDETDKVFYTAGLEPIRTTYKDFPTNKFTRENDILLARNGTPYVYIPVSGACYTDHIIRANIRENADRRFVQYALQHSISSFSVDTVSIPTWSASIWNEQVIPMPTKEEQTIIADFLDERCAEIDSIIKANETSIAKLKEYRDSIIYEAVTGKIEV